MEPHPVSGDASKKEEEDQTKAVHLMEFGITAGLAAAVQIPTKSDYGPDFASVTSMPYLMIMPGFWGSEKESRKYCASQWGFGSQEKAHAASIAMSRQWARRTIAAGADRLASSVSVKALAREWSTLGVKGGTYASKLEKISKMSTSTTLNKDERAKQLEALVGALASEHWNPSIDATCWYRKFGVWVGRPMTYRVESKVKGESVGELEYEPIGAFGLGFSPNAYLSFVVGAAYGSLAVTAADSTTTTHQTWAWTIGVGGNLDIIPGLIIE